MPHESLWRAWLSEAHGQLPAAALQHLLCGAPVHARTAMQQLLASRCALHGDVVAKQLLFSLHVHAPPNWTNYDWGSLFHGRLVQHRMTVPTWLCWYPPGFFGTHLAFLTIHM